MKKLEREIELVQEFEEPTAEDPIGSGQIRRKVRMPPGDSRILYGLEYLPAYKYRGRIYFTEQLPLEEGTFYDDELGPLSEYFPDVPVYVLVKNLKQEEIPQGYKQGDVVVRKIQRPSEELLLSLCKIELGQEFFEKCRNEIEQHYQSTLGIRKKRKRTEEELEKYRERDEKRSNWKDPEISELANSILDDILEEIRFKS